MTSEILFVVIGSILIYRMMGIDILIRRRRGGEEERRREGEEVEVEEKEGGEVGGERDRERGRRYRGR